MRLLLIRLVLCGMGLAVFALLLYIVALRAVSYTECRDTRARWQCHGR